VLLDAQFLRPPVFVGLCRAQLDAVALPADLAPWVLVRVLAHHEPEALHDPAVVLARVVQEPRPAARPQVLVAALPLEAVAVLEDHSARPLVDVDAMLKSSSPRR
jgi:hypothetical protein